MVSGVWKIHVPSFVQIRRKMHDFASKPPLPHLALGVGFSIWSRQYLFPANEKYMCQVWSRSVGKCMIFARNPSLSAFTPRGWFFEMKQYQYLFTEDEKYICQVWSRSVRKCMILHQPHTLFHHSGPGVGYSKWNSASICFRGRKNNVPSLVQIRRKVHDFASIPPPIPSFWPWGWFFVLKPCQYLFLGNEKYMCQVWSRPVGKCVIWIKPTPYPNLAPGLVFRNEIVPVFVSGG